MSPTSSSTETSTSELSFSTGNNNNNNKHSKHQLTGSSSNTVVVAETNSEMPNRKSSLSRHRSSGCLSRNSQSTLSLSRAKSSSALNKVRSRSMNLLLLRNGGDLSSTSSSSSSDEGEGRDRRRAVEAKRRSQQLLNGRPRSYSVRAASVCNEIDSVAAAATKGWLLLFLLFEEEHFCRRWAPDFFVTSLGDLFIKMGHSRPLFRTADLWNRKWPLYQLSHNHCHSLGDLRRAHHEASF